MSNDATDDPDPVLTEYLGHSIKSKARALRTMLHAMPREPRRAALQIIADELDLFTGDDIDEHYADTTDNWGRIS